MSLNRRSSRKTAALLFGDSPDCATPLIDPLQPRLPYEVHLNDMRPDEARAVLECRWGLRYLAAPAGTGPSVGPVKLPIGWWVQYDLARPAWMKLLDINGCERARILDRTFAITSREAYLEPLPRYHIVHKFDDTADEAARLIVFDREARKPIRQSPWITGGTEAVNAASIALITKMMGELPGFDDPMQLWSDLSIKTASEASK